MVGDAGELVRRLASDAEAVCRYYLSRGKRSGRYWKVGDARNSPGRSMYVRLIDTASGTAGKWTDAATGEHGDLLDVIRESCGLVEFREVAEEARRFLALPRAEPRAAPRPPVPSGSAEAARHLWAMTKPLAGTLAEAYLRARAITALHGTEALRFHACCYHRPKSGGPTELWPAMIAAVTDLDGNITGVHRTWLAADGLGKAPVSTPRRAMGLLLGNAVRFGAVSDVLAAGEGIETVLTLRMVLPRMPMAAALSAAHLAALIFPPTLRRLYVARDNDPAGDRAMADLAQRAHAGGIEAIALSPRLGDFNEDRRAVGTRELRATVRVQLAPEDVRRFLMSSSKEEGRDG